MASQTTTLHLKKPALTDDALIGDINDNMDLIDSYATTNNQAIATKANSTNFKGASYNYRSYANWQAALTAEKANLFPSDGTYCFTIITSGGSPHIFTMIKNGTFLSGIHQSYTSCEETVYSTDGGSTWTVRALNMVTTLLTNESCAFTTGYASLGKSFTLARNSIVRIDVAYNNSLPVSIGCKPTDTAGAGSRIFAENPNKTENVAGLSATGWLEAGTYYLWGSAKTATNNSVTVYAVG